MSTVDPIEARRLREMRRQGSRTALVMLVLGLVAVFVGGALELRSIYGFAQFTGDGDQPPSAIFMQIAGLPAILLGIFLSIGGARRYTGKLLAIPFVGPGTLVFAGFAVGAWWGLSALDDPNLVLSLLPIVLSVLAVLMFLAGARARLRRRAQRDVLGELAVSGRVVPGVITDIAEIDGSSGGLIGPVTVKFTDLAGVDRWVQKTGQWRRAELPRTVILQPSSSTRRTRATPSASGSGPWDRPRLQTSAAGIPESDGASVPALRPWLGLQAVAASAPARCRARG